MPRLPRYRAIIKSITMTIIHALLHVLQRAAISQSGLVEQPRFTIQRRSPALRRGSRNRMDAGLVGHLRPWSGSGPRAPLPDAGSGSGFARAPGGPVQFARLVCATTSHGSGQAGCTTCPTRMPRGAAPGNRTQPGPDVRLMRPLGRGSGRAIISRREFVARAARAPLVGVVGIRLQGLPRTRAATAALLPSARRRTPSRARRRARRGRVPPSPSG